MIIVSNASPIINLAAIDRLYLLKKRFGKIVIPQAVYNEIAIIGRGKPGDREIRTSDWIEVMRVTDIPLLTVLKRELDDGEAETIVLAIESKADLALIDERDARTTAAKLGLRFMGLLGVLVEAKQQGYIQEVRSLMDRLTTQAGFWIDKDLYQLILTTAGE